MPCCNAAVVTKQSPLGTRFFAHKTKGNCTSAPETEEHHYLKRAVILAARKNGWKAQTEVMGKSPSGAEWRADVLAIKGKHKVAIEIQWSGQTNEETIRRQQLYKECGIRGLWLLRQPGFPVTKDLPAVCIGGDIKEGFTALIPDNSNMTNHYRKLQKNWKQVLPMEQFLNAVFKRRFQFISFLDGIIKTSVRGVRYSCHHCKTLNTQIAPVEFNIIFKHGYPVENFSVQLSNLKTNSEFTDIFLKKIPKTTKFGNIKIIKMSNHNVYPNCLSQQSYLKNVCFNCDSSIDTGFTCNLNKFTKFTPIIEFTVKASLEWHKLFDTSPFNSHWGILPP